MYLFVTDARRVSVITTAVVCGHALSILKKINNMDISKYTTVTEFHDAIRDSEYTAPPEMCRCLVKLMNQRGLNFQEAYNFLWERKLIFVSGNFYFYNLKADKLWG